MRNFYLVFFLLINIGQIKAQDFSNKGKDFWVGYGYHVRMKQAANGGSVNEQDMKLYFATDGPTNITVTIPGIGWTRTYSTTSSAPNIIISDLIPKSAAKKFCWLIILVHDIQAKERSHFTDAKTNQRNSCLTFRQAFQIKQTNH